FSSIREVAEAGQPLSMLGPSAIATWDIHVAREVEFPLGLTGQNSIALHRDAHDSAELDTDRTLHNNESRRRGDSAVFKGLPSRTRRRQDRHCSSLWRLSSPGTTPRYGV